MNSYERVIGIITGKPVDRIPVSGVFGLCGAKETDCELKRYYNDPNAYVKGQIAVVEKYSPDILFTPFAAAIEAEAFGCQIKYFDCAPPNIIKRPCSRIEDIETLIIPTFNNDIFSNYILPSTRMLCEKYKGIKPICGVWLDPMNALASVIGPELYMELLLFNPKKFASIIEVFEKHSIKLGNALLDAGVDMLVDVASMCSVAMITKEMAQDIAFPILARTYKQINGNIVLHHGGHKIGPFMNIYKDLSNLVAVAIDNHDDLENVYNTIESTQVLLGNISGPTLDTLTPKQIQQICYKILDKMADKPRFILMTSGADIPYDTTEEQIFALMNSTSNYLLDHPKIDHPKKEKILGIACSIFKLDLEYLISKNRISIPFIYLDSNLHMKPDILQASLDKTVTDSLEKYEKIILVYGDCHPYMLDNYDPKRVLRVNGINCSLIILGSAKYKKLRKEGAFFVFNEWADRWREIFVEDIGLTDKLAPIFMQSMHSSIIYLDTGTAPIPYSSLEEMSDYFQLPYSIMEVNLDTLCNAILESTM